MMIFPIRMKPTTLKCKFENNSRKKGYRVSEATTYETQVLIQFKMK